MGCVVTRDLLSKYFGGIDLKFLHFIDIQYIVIETGRDGLLDVGPTGGIDASDVDILEQLDGEFLLRFVHVLLLLGEVALAVQLLQHVVHLVEEELCVLVVEEDKVLGHLDERLLAHDEVLDVEWDGEAECDKQEH